MAEAILFDWDGVLADSVNIGFAIHQEIGKKFGFHYFRSLQQYRKKCTGDYRSLYASLGATQTTILAMELFFLQEQKKYRDTLKLFGGVKSILKNLVMKGYKLGIVSNNNGSFITQKLQSEGCRKFVGSICAWQEGKIKPDPAQLVRCMQELGVHPSNAAMVGDMDVDIAAATNAKVATIIAATYGYHPKERLSGAHIYIDSIEMLPEVLV